jgi:hypothetical protein
MSALAPGADIVSVVGYVRKVPIAAVVGVIVDAFLCMLLEVLTLRRDRVAAGPSSAKFAATLGHGRKP